jgi:hypothetical protein
MPKMPSAAPKIKPFSDRSSEIDLGMARKWPRKVFMNTCIAHFWGFSLVITYTLEQIHFILSTGVPIVSARPPTKSRRHSAHICIGGTNNDQSRLLTHLEPVAQSGRQAQANPSHFTTRGRLSLWLLNSGA